MTKIIFLSFVLSLFASANSVHDREKEKQREFARTWNWSKMDLKDSEPIESTKLLKNIMRTKSFVLANTDPDGPAKIYLVERVKCSKSVAVSMSGKKSDPTFKCFFNDMKKPRLGGDFAKEFTDALERAGSVTDSEIVNHWPKKEEVTHFYAQSLRCSEYADGPKCTFWVGEKAKSQ